MSLERLGLGNAAVAASCLEPSMEVLRRYDTDIQPACAVTLGKANKTPPDLLPTRDIFCPPGKATATRTDQ